MEENSWREGSSGELSLTECTYTTEFIKVWMIDDVSLPSGALISTSVYPSNQYRDYEFYIFSDINNILCSVVKLFVLNGTMLMSKGLKWQTVPGRFRVLWMGPPVNSSGNYSICIKYQDMVHGDLLDTTMRITIYSGGVSAYLHFNIPTSSWQAGNKLYIPDIALGANGPEDTLYMYRWSWGGYQECEMDNNGYWTVPYYPAEECSLEVVLKCVVTLKDPEAKLEAWKFGYIYARAAPEITELRLWGNSVRVSWRSNSTNDYYEIWRQNPSKDKVYHLVGTATQSPYFDTTIQEGNQVYRYKVRGNFTNFSNYAIVSFYFLKHPIIQSIEFEDSIVRVLWDDLSEKNERYYIGKRVSGRVAGTGQDTTFWYHIDRYLPGDADCFIDTFPIEGMNIYRVAAIDNSGYRWYSDYDTVYVPFYKASELRGISLPDTSILFRWCDRTYLESGYSLRKDNIFGSIGWVPADSCSFIYKDADLSAHKYYLVSWQKMDNVYFHWEICDSTIYEWCIDTEPPVIMVHGGGKVIGGDSVIISWAQKTTMVLRRFG